MNGNHVGFETHIAPAARHRFTQACARKGEKFHQVCAILCFLLAVFATIRDADLRKELFELLAARDFDFWLRDAFASDACSWIREDQPPIDRELKYSVHDLQFVGESLGGYFGAALSDPAVAVLMSHVANGCVHEEWSEVLDVNFFSQSRAWFERVPHRVQPEFGRFLKREVGIVRNNERAHAFTPLRQAAFGKLAVFCLERTSKLLAASLEEGIVTARCFEPV